MVGQAKVVLDAAHSTYSDFASTMYYNHAYATDRSHLNTQPILLPFDRCRASRTFLILMDQPVDPNLDYSSFYLVKSMSTTVSQKSIMQ